MVEHYVHTLIIELERVGGEIGFKRDQVKHSVHCVVGANNAQVTHDPSWEEKSLPAAA